MYAEAVVYLETGFRKKEFPFQWKIKDYFRDFPESSLQDFPIKLTFECNNSSVWELSLEVIGNFRSGIEVHCNCKLTQILESPIMNQLMAGCEIRIFDVGANNNGRTGPVNISVGEKLRSVHMANINGEFNWGSLTINGELIIQGKLFVYEPYSKRSDSLDTIMKKTQERASSKVPQDFHGRKYILSSMQDFNNFLYWDKTGTENFSDVEVTSNDGIVHYAHRCILSAKSEVFEAMFRSDMEESRTGKIKLEDISGKTMEALLQFIYTGTIHEQWNDSEILPNLAYAAHKYQVKDLLEFFDEVIGKICDVKTAVPLLALSERLELKTAEKDLRDFFQRTMEGRDYANLDYLLSMRKAFMA